MTIRKFKKKFLTSALIALFIQTPEINREVVNSELSECLSRRKEISIYERKRIKLLCFLSLFVELI